MTVLEKIQVLVKQISELPGVIAIGQTGDIHVIPIPGKNDVDLFILCDQIPPFHDREILNNACHDLFVVCHQNQNVGVHWGISDEYIVDGVPVWAMYFALEETVSYINEVISGKHLDSDQGFYPTGRIQAILNMNSLYDKDNVWPAFKQRLKIYPDDFQKKMIEYHLPMAIDEEDFSRALDRNEVLFYHQTLEHAIDHFLQALFALNKTFFPSRKRTESYLNKFIMKPGNCYERMTKVIELGASCSSLEASFAEWQSLVSDLNDIV